MPKGSQTITPQLWLRPGFNAFVLVMLALGLGVVLTFVGVKMLLAHSPWKLDTLLSLGVIVLILAVSMVMSLLRPKKTIIPTGVPKPHQA